MYLSKLDICCQEKQILSKAVVKMLEKVLDLSNTNLIKNADGLLLRNSVNSEVEWVGKKKERLDQRSIICPIKYFYFSFSEKYVTCKNMGVDFVLFIFNWFVKYICMFEITRGWLFLTLICSIIIMVPWYLVFFCLSIVL